MLFRLAETMGRRVFAAVDALGKATLFLCASAAGAFTPPLRVRNVIRQIHFIGVRSL